MRITQAQLERQVELLNNLLDRPATPWTKTDKGIKANIGNLHLSGAYGGVALNEMATDGGGVHDISAMGHVPKRELHTFMAGMIAAIRLADENRKAA